MLVTRGFSWTATRFVFVLSFFADLWHIHTELQNYNIVIFRQDQSVIFCQTKSTMAATKCDAICLFGVSPPMLSVCIQNTTKCAPMRHTLAVPHAITASAALGFDARESVENKIYQSPLTDVWSRGREPGFSCAFDTPTKCHHSAIRRDAFNAIHRKFV